jgi:hypothetical protein
MATGMGYRAIASDAGLALPTFRRAYSNRPNRVRPPMVRWATAYRILRVTPAPRRLDATGPRRRLQALRAIGYSRMDIQRLTGLHEHAVGEISLGIRKRVTRATAAHIAGFYDDLSWTPGTSKRAVTEAAGLGWHGPDWWPADTIDDPTARPQRPTRRPQIPIDDVEWLLRSGVAGEALALRFGVNQDSVERACQRAGRLDLARWVRTGEQPRMAA